MIINLKQNTYEIST